MDLPHQVLNHSRAQFGFRVVHWHVAVETNLGAVQPRLRARLAAEDFTGDLPQTRKPHDVLRFCLGESSLVLLVKKG